MAKTTSNKTKQDKVGGLKKEVETLKEENVRLLAELAALKAAPKKKSAGHSTWPNT